MFNKTVQMIVVALIFNSSLSNAEERVVDNGKSLSLVFSKVESLSLVNLNGDVDLMPYSGDVISVGSTNLNDYDFSQQNGELTLTQKPNSSTSYQNGSISIVNSGNNNVSSVTIGGSTISSKHSKIEKLSIKIPSKIIPIKIENVSGQFQIGDLNSPLFITLNSGNFQIGKISDLNLTINGAGSVVLHKNVATAILKIEGAGDFKSEADIEKLDVSINGTGNVEIDGTVTSAKIVSEGIGNIKINKLLNKPNVSNSGLGSVEIKNKGY
jgi:hypothetical protein